MAARPAAKAVSRNNPKPEDSAGGAGVAGAGGGTATAAVGTRVKPDGTEIADAFAEESIVIAAIADLRLGGKQIVSLQLWYRTLAVMSVDPGTASGFSSMSYHSTYSPENVSVSMP